MIAGVLVVDKPEALTSHDVVAAARRVLGERRIGHCGTLDPMATGVLALAIGPATRLVQYLSADRKQYDAIVHFGRETDTYDATGEVVGESAVRPSQGEVEKALREFLGPSQQVPPAFSAKKIGGVRAYALARRKAAGTTVLAPIEVMCHDLTLTAFDGERAWLTMTVSAGFYVRSLAHDLGRALGSGAVLDALRRTRAGHFGVEQAVSFERLVRASHGELLADLVPLENLLPETPLLSLSDEDVQRVRRGLDLPAPSHLGEEATLVRLQDPAGRLVALAVPADRPGFLHPSAVLG
jgi:tRNA pseudouridine55 synthase